MSSGTKVDLNVAATTFMQFAPPSSVRHAIVAATVLGVSPALAWPGMGNANFSVSVTVIDNCTISSRGLSFGSQARRTRAGLTARGAITARCAKGDAVAIALNQGANPAPGSTAAMPVRRMTDGTTSYLPYRIYIAAAREGSEWDGATADLNETSTVIAAGSSSPIVFASYASMPGGKMPRGHYVDVVTATITF